MKGRLIGALITLAILTLLGACGDNGAIVEDGCACSPPTPDATTEQGLSVAAPAFIVYPDTKLTPGATLPVTVAQICVSGYSSGVRNVTVQEKNQVYSEYGIKSHTTGQYEVDHLISLELGGSNDIRNLWPQPSSPKPGFHEKDALENVLHTLVCAGTVPLADAQRMISTDWWAAYQKYVRK